MKKVQLKKHWREKSKNIWEDQAASINTTIIKKR
jgi:hypothetical protein